MQLAFCESLRQVGAPASDLGDGLIIGGTSSHGSDPAANISVPLLLTLGHQSDPHFILGEKSFEIGNKDKQYAIEKGIGHAAVFKLADVSSDNVVTLEEVCLFGDGLTARIPLNKFIKN